MKKRKIFEEWFVKQFGDNSKALLGGFHEEGGYADETVNSMWIGFNAGIELQPFL